MEIKFEESNIKDIGNGSKRSGELGRGDYSLVPKEVIEAYAKHLQSGVEKGYPRNNWKLGQPLSRLHSSLLRHSFQLLSGALDEPHASAVLFNIGAIIYTREAIKVGKLPESLEDVFDGEQFKTFYGRYRENVKDIKEAVETKELNFDDLETGAFFSWVCGDGTLLIKMDAHTYRNELSSARISPYDDLRVIRRSVLATLAMIDQAKVVKEASKVIPARPPLYYNGTGLTYMSLIHFDDVKVGESLMFESCPGDKCMKKSADSYTRNGVTYTLQREVNCMCLVERKIQ